jgi:mRNA interferase RelE/StbE
LGRPAQLRIRRYLDKLSQECSDPRQRGEPLRSRLAGFWKYRIGDYRLLCQITEDEVIVLCLLAATHRSQAYSESKIEELLNRAHALLNRLKD